MLLGILSSAVKNADVLFEGLVTEIICVIISFVLGGGIGGAIGFKVGKTKQNQKAGKNSNQTQIGSVNIHNAK